MKILVVGIYGDEGSFTEDAAKIFIKGKKVKASYRYLITAEAVLSAIEDGSVDFGVLPIQNSAGGIVIEVIHAAAKHQFTIAKIFNMHVRQNLLTLPSTAPSTITRIISHDQALKQCRMYLKRTWPNAELVEYADTALAAKNLAAGKLPKNSAVIASRAAAKRYKLKVIGESIQDLKDNFTTFIAGRRA